MTVFIPRTELPFAPRRPLGFYQPLVDALRNVFAPAIGSGSTVDPLYRLPHMRPEASVLLGGQSKPAPKKVAEPQAKGKPRGGSTTLASNVKKSGFKSALAKLSAKAQNSPLLQKRSAEEEEDEDLFGTPEPPAQISLVVSGAAFGRHPKPS